MTLAGESPSPAGVKGTAIVVTYNSARCVASCLSALASQPGWEVILIDNASKDDTAKRATQFAPRVRVVANRGNIGLASAINQAVAMSRGDVCVAVNPDAVAEPGALDKMAAALSIYEAGAVGGVLLLEGDRLQKGNMLRRFPTLGSSMAELLLLNKVWRRNPWNRSYRYLDMDYDQPQPVDNPAGACLAFRRKAWESVGGFDEGFYPCWFEDVDFCHSVIKAGWKIVYEPAAVFRHEGAHSVGQLAPYRHQLLWHSNYVRYFRKHHGQFQTLVLRAIIAAGLSLRAGLCLVAPPRGSSRLEAASSYLRTVWRCALRTVEPRRLADPGDNPTAT